MNNISIAGIGMYAVLIVFVLKTLHITADQSTVEAAIAGGVQAVGFVLWVIGQIRRPDLKFGLVRQA